MNLVLMAVSGVGCSAAAQVVMKFSSRYEPWTARWILSLGLAALLYGGSFLLYAFILRRAPLSKLGPLMTIAVSILVVLAGWLLFGERLNPRQLMGVALGGASIILLVR